MSKKKVSEGKVHIFLIAFAIGFAALTWFLQYGTQVGIKVTSSLLGETDPLMFSNVTSFMGGAPQTNSDLLKKMSEVLGTLGIELNVLPAVPLAAVAYYSMFVIIGLMVLGIFTRGMLKKITSGLAVLVGIFATAVLFCFPILFAKANGIDTSKNTELPSIVTVYGPSLIIAGVSSILATLCAAGTLVNSK